MLGIRAKFASLQEEFTRRAVPIDSVRSPRRAINLARLTSLLTSNFTSFVASAKPVQS